jgi:hypothetical protein
MPTTMTTMTKEKMYCGISGILLKERRIQVNAIVMGDFNSTVREGSINEVVDQLESLEKN